MSISKPYGCNYSFPEVVMPVDLAMHAQVSPQLIGMSSLRPSSSNMSSPELLRARLSPPSPTSSLSSSSSGSSLSSYSPESSTLRKKKRVVFADAKGLALSSVRIFTADPSETETEDAPQPEECVKARAPIQSMRLRLKLGFPQPVVDRASLKVNFVQLESCSVTERVLSGTVRVCNLKCDKTVFIRITFDSWRSQKDIACTYVREQHTNLETKLYAFNVSLPSELNQKDRLEFVVGFQSGSLKLIDHNNGKNYQIYVENVASEPRLVMPSRRNFVTPSPQRLSVWPVVRSHPLQIAKNLACKSPPYPDRLVHRTWGRMTNVAPLC
ncbi:protein phosphatase 1 regulatory subunit 3C-B [Pimephales promelas]|uniref:protein phosphatase 1 regulatory subunit 3C-B n=1 Tax=Pimephales promelas TaxID=90988 RepID=UPI0019557C1C|nr:protein phosphatase 1 regulatory subunit 3C-B [Pimephales promelas]XP_039531692.1 protein phosphatase 1 regulatory subunit 3C-B [Pimephales promelas]KAG1970720.1 protein phosphatase 1 regulatory subunit 3B [Pimephales promelas]